VVMTQVGDRFTRPKTPGIVWEVKLFISAMVEVHDVSDHLDGSGRHGACLVSLSLLVPPEWVPLKP